MISYGKTILSYRPRLEIGPFVARWAFAQNRKRHESFPNPGSLDREKQKQQRCPCLVTKQHQNLFSSEIFFYFSSRTKKTTV